MAVQATDEKETWSNEALEPARDSSSSGSSDEKSAAGTTRTPNRLLKASSAAIRSAQHGFGKVSSASVRLYRHSWPKVSSASVRLYERWPKVRSKTVRIYQHVSPKLSSASVRLYQRTWPKVSSTANRLYYRQNGPTESSQRVARSPIRDRLVAASMSLRFFQLVSALYVFITVTESFRNKITYDGRVRQIQLMMLTTLIYSSVAIVCFLLVNVSKKLKNLAWHKAALVSLPADVSMICLFIAKDVVFGVHSYECASSSVIVSAAKQYNAVQNMDSLELRSFLENKPPASHWAVSKESLVNTCLLSSSVYVVCFVAALSYMGSVTITIFQLLNYRKSVSDSKNGHYPGHIEQAMPDTMQSPPRMYQQRPPMLASFSSEPSSSSNAPLPYPAEPPSPKYANLPPSIFEGMTGARPPRTSIESTSSMDPDQYVVSDGFRPESERPPSYRSSRESSLGPPEYRSRPPSLHTVVLVGP